MKSRSEAAIGPQEEVLELLLDHLPQMYPEHFQVTPVSTGKSRFGPETTVKIEMDDFKGSYVIGDFKNFPLELASRLVQEDLVLLLILISPNLQSNDPIRSGTTILVLGLSQPTVVSWWPVFSGMAPWLQVVPVARATLLLLRSADFCDGAGTSPRPVRVEIGIMSLIIILSMGVYLV